MANVLVIDDELNIRRTLRMVLEGEGYAVLLAPSAEEGLVVVEEEAIDVVLLDVRLPGMDGLVGLERILAHEEPPLVIMISGHATLADAVKATKLGAFDFLEKPLERDRVLLSVQNAVQQRGLTRQLRALESQVAVKMEMIGESEIMLHLFHEIEKVAPTKGRVLIAGESGTGKELVARAVHRLSARSEGPFIKVNCAAIPAELIESELFGYEKGAFTGAGGRKRGLIELAHGGTLFLDEVGDMSPSAQAKVLRVLQTGEITRVGGERTMEVDIRVIAASNHDLRREVEAGRFREDLFFRLSVVPIQTPPLRDHGEDIPLLVTSFMRQFCQENGFRPKEMEADGIRALQAYSWPGNVRELKNLIERLVIMGEGGAIGSKDLPGYIFQPPNLKQRPLPDKMTLREYKEMMEREYILHQLRIHEWNISRTSEMLGIERTNLHKKIKALGITRENNA